jgi:ABC-2 type transport system ATP-binding protein
MESQEPSLSSAQSHKPFIEVVDLTKQFGEVAAVNHITFNVCQGELFGFLGPIGAGKTTTINMLIGLARPDSGTIRIGGLEAARNPKAAQHLIGVVPDESNLYPELTGFDNLCFCAALYGMPKNKRQARARKLLETFGLSEADELELRLSRAIDPERSRVTVTTAQDEADSQHIRLTPAQP